MAIDVTRNFGVDYSGSQGVIFGLGANPTIGNVVDGSIYYPGSIIQVQEIIDIQTSVYDKSLVDVDFDWFEKKQYLGTYQIQAHLDLYRDADDEGFLISEYQRITRYSYYTVVANGQGAVVLPNRSYVSDCNFDLRDDIISNPPAIDIIRQVLDDKGENYPVFVVENTLEPVPLADDRFYPKMYGVGLFLKPGVQLDLVRYRARAINGIRVSLPQALSRVCSLRQSSCEAQYQGWLQSVIASGANLIDAAECERIGPFNCITIEWVCPDDETFVRTIYQQGDS